jgi:glycosyltransferase involved in cell wall biosynthesis
VAARVCMLVHEHYPRDFRVRREARVLLAAGAEVTVVSLREPGQPSRESIDGAEVIRLPIRRHRGRPVPVYVAEYLAFALAAGSLLAARRRFDVVHVHAPPDFLVLAAVVPRLRGARVILDIHDLTPELYRSRFKRAGGPAAQLALKTAEKVSCAAADRVITVTEVFKQRLVSRGIDERKILVLHNCPDPGIFKPRRACAGKRKEFVVMHHGTLLYRYGVDVLVDAFRLASTRVKNARLQIYGRGDWLPRLREMVSEYSLGDRVTLFGETGQEEVALALSSADLCVVPNRQEPFTDLLLPTKLLEALRVGCPAVASATTVVAEAFASGGVRLVPPGDARALAKVIVELAADGKARAALAAEGKRQAKRFDWKREQKKLLALYAELGVASEVPSKH